MLFLIAKETVGKHTKALQRRDITQQSKYKERGSLNIRVQNKLETFAVTEQFTELRRGLERSIKELHLPVKLPEIGKVAAALRAPEIQRVIPKDLQSGV